MKILCLDCSAGNYVSLIDENGFIFRENHEPKSDSVLALVSEVLNEAKINLDELSAIANVIGPGSFTGLRVSATLTKGLSIAKDIKVIAITSFEACEYNNDEGKAIILDGFGDFVYLKTDDVKCVTISDAQAEIKAKNLEPVCSDKVAAKMGYSNFLTLSFNREKVASKKFAKREFIFVDDLEPLYLRASQAEIEREKKLNILNNNTAEEEKQQAKTRGARTGGRKN